jgi:hypothetical protein
MDGYVIAGETGYFLNRNRAWQKKKAVQAYVFTVAETEEILREAKADGWKTIPTQKIPATYFKGIQRVKIIGPATPAYESKVN